MRKNEDDLIISENGIVMHFVKTETNYRLMGIYLEEKFSASCVSSPEKYVYNQVHLAGSDRSGHRGAKAVEAYESKTAKYKNFSDVRTDKYRRIVFTSQTDKVEITTTFDFINGSRTLRCAQSVKNISDSPVCLEEVNSLFLYGIGGEHPDLSKLVLYIPTNSWHVEAQWKKSSLRDLFLFNGNEVESMKRISVSNTGSWSTKEYLPMGILEDKTEGVFLLWQIESNGSWRYELGDLKNKLYLNVGGPDFENNNWAKVLDVGESFEGVAASVSLSTSLNGVLGEITSYRRAIRRENDDNIAMPIIFNAYMHAFWDYPSESALKPLIDTVSTLGCGYFCIDAGWHDEEDWWEKLGDFRESKSRFPSGVKKTIDYIKSKGMKAGIWLEIEDVGVRSDAAGMPDGCFFRRNGARVVNHERLSLDFTQKEVLERADRLIAQVVELGAEYIKIDYNIDSGVGSDCHTRTLGDGLLMHNRAYLDWLRETFKKYPDIVIENCASGGCRMDYAMLSLCSIQSTSDQTDYKKYPYIAANALSAVCPEQAAVWAYPLANMPEKIDPTSLNDEVIIMNMVNSMLGRIHLASRLDLLQNTQLSLVREAITYYNKIIGIKGSSLPYLPLGFTEFGADFAAAGIKSDKKLYLAVWNLGGDRNRTLPLPEINAKAVTVGYPAKRNFNVSLEDGAVKIDFGADYQARILEVDYEI